MARVITLLFSKVLSKDFLCLANTPNTFTGEKIKRLADFYDCEFYYPSDILKEDFQLYSFNRGIGDKDISFVTKKLSLALISKRRFETLQYGSIAKKMKKVIDLIPFCVDYAFLKEDVKFYNDTTGEILFAYRNDLTSRTIPPQNYPLHNSLVIQVGMPRINPSALRS